MVLGRNERSNPAGMLRAEGRKRKGRAEASFGEKLMGESRDQHQRWERPSHAGE